MEFWQDVGANPLPYQRIQGSTQTFGLAAKWSRCVVNNQMIFLAQNAGGANYVMMLNCYTPQKISTSDVDSIIEGIADAYTIADAVALTYSAWGHAMYQLTFPSANYSLLYDQTTNLWSEVQTGLGLTGRHLADTGINFNGYQLASDAANGDIYYFTDNVQTDNGVSIKRQITSRHIRDAGNTLGISEVFLDMETGNALQSGQGSNPQISMERSRDGGRTFGPPRLTSVGLVGQYYSPRAIWRRCGRERDFVFRFTMTDPVPFIITGGSAVLNQSAAIKAGGT